MSREQVTRTSREAFRGISEDGTLGEVQSEVLEALRVARRPVTGREIAKHKDIEGAWKRLPELERRGHAVRVGTRRCTVTGRNATAWTFVS